MPAARLDSARVDLAALTIATFQPHVGSAFTVPAAAAATVTLVLESATAIGSWTGGRQPFRLTFHGPREPLLPQSTYGLAHTELGALEIFIVPIAQTADRTSYEAIFA